MNDNDLNKPPDKIYLQCYDEDDTLSNWVRISYSIVKF